MRKVVVTEFMTLDGVVQSPSYPDEDTEGGFEHGGWHAPYLDATSMQWVMDNVTRAGGYLLGRRTYEIFAAHSPNASPEEQVLAEPLNTRPKYVASMTLTAPLAWQNATLLQGNVPDAVVALKEEDGGDLYVIGSTRLAQALINHDLVDEYRLMIDPLVLGTGKRLFQSADPCRALQLLDLQVTTTGAILAAYARRN